MQKKTPEKTIQMQHAMEDESVEVCKACENVYRVEWLKPSSDHNDFGFRHCPFCGHQFYHFNGMRVDQPESGGFLDEAF